MDKLYQCYKCKEFRELSCFHKSNVRQRQGYCKSCIRLREKRKIIIKHIPIIGLGRTCNKCLIKKTWSEFGKDKNCKNGYKSICKLCRNKQELISFHASPERKAKVALQGKEFARKNPNKIKEWRKKHQFCDLRRKGIDIDQEKYNRLLDSQKHGCAICGGVEIIKSKAIRLSVDHCHKTNKVRGLLCGNCNRAIGLLQDSPHLLLRAAEYLKKHSPIMRMAI